VVAEGPASSIQLSNARVQNGSLIFEWTARPGAKYEIQSKDNLSEPDWNLLGTVLVADAAGAYTNRIDGPGARFYRLRVIP
jgi:hypothetical protein